MDLHLAFHVLLFRCFLLRFRLGWEESDLSGVFLWGGAFEQAGYSNVYCDLLDLV